VGPYTENQDTKITCKAYGGTASFQRPTEIQIVLRAYGGTALFQGSTEAQFVLRAYGAVVQFGFKGLQRYTYSLFGPTKV